MTNNPPSLQVAVTDHSAIVKVNGRANFTTSVGFKHLVSELRQRGFRQFALDLSHCMTMDSTFLGVLAGTAVDLADGHGSSLAADARSGDPRLHLLNPNQRVTDLLDNLGIAELFQTVYCEIPQSAEANLATASESKPSQEELSRTCLEAHRLLMNLNPDNVPKFKDVAEFLAQDLRKLESRRNDNPGDDSSSGPKP